MSSYDEHLITMAGGDGCVLDQLAAIQTRAGYVASVIGNNDALGPRGLEKTFLLAEEDIPDLLAMVRERDAKLDRVRELIRLGTTSKQILAALNNPAALTATEGE